MKKLILFITLILFMCFFACRKDEKTVEANKDSLKVDSLSNLDFFTLLPLENYATFTRLPLEKIIQFDTLKVSFFIKRPKDADYSRIIVWDSEVKDILKYADRINENIDLLKKITFDPSILNIKSKSKYKNIEFYYDIDGLVKIKIYSLDDIFNYTKEYYFKNGELNFVSVKGFEIKDIEDCIGGVSYEFFFVEEELIGYSRMNLGYNIISGPRKCLSDKRIIDEKKRSYYENLILNEVKELKKIVSKFRN